MKLLRTMILTTALAHGAGAALAQDFQRGLAAAQEGDFDTALIEWLPLAEQGNPSAQSNLGGMYYVGYGVPQNYSEAAKWYHLAAEQEVASAQYRLGSMYIYGNGVLQDYVEAEKWYRLSAEQGYASAQYSLGVMSYYGDGVLQDYVEAEKWYRLSAEQGYALAQFSLGVMYDRGNLMLQDNVSAHMWYNIAAANGAEDAAQYRHEIAAKMTAANISQAQEMARECMSSGYEDCGW